MAKGINMPISVPDRLYHTNSYYPMVHSWVWPKETLSYWGKVCREKLRMPYLSSQFYAPSVHPVRRNLGRRGGCQPIYRNNENDAAAENTEHNGGN